MNFIFPLLAALLQASSFTLDKVVLSMRRVDFRAYTGTSFPLIFLITLVVFFIARPPLHLHLFSGNLLPLLFISIGMIICTNLIFYRALDDDRLGEIQTIDLLQNIPIILFASIIFADERKPLVIFPAMIASCAVIWSHWEHHHFKMAKHTLPFLAWSFITAPVGASISKMLLASWSPISLELVRSGAVALILGPLFSQYTRKISFRAFSLLLATNILTSIAWILFYFSYQRSGIIYTLLIFSLQPLLVYLAAFFFLGEPFQAKKALAFVLVLASIAAAQIIG